MQICNHSASIISPNIKNYKNHIKYDSIHTHHKQVPFSATTIPPKKLQVNVTTYKAIPTDKSKVEYLLIRFKIFTSKKICDTKYNRIVELLSRWGTYAMMGFCNHKNGSRILPDQSSFSASFHHMEAGSAIPPCLLLMITVETETITLCPRIFMIKRFFHTYTCPVYCWRSVQLLGFSLLCNLIHASQPIQISCLMGNIFYRPIVCLRLPSAPTSR